MKIGFVAAAFAAALAVSAPAFAAEGGAEYTRLSANASSSVVAQAEGVTTFRSADANGGGGELRRSADAQGGSELRTFAEAGAGGLQRIADAQGGSELRTFADAGEAQHVG
jgi:hypothetical protein